MPKIGDLLNFEKIKDVIDIDGAYDGRKMVENYVISPSMEDYLVNILNDFQKDTHKAVQVIGGYGSGKSHLLAFIISILNDKSVRSYIQNEKVREAAEKINRDFVVIRWELQPNDVDLSAYFYDRIEQQFEENYGIKYEFPELNVVDHKKMVIDVVQAIKAQDPTRGLIVVVDEISDFLKQKDKEKITRDVQFLRILGQVAQESDFTFIGAMQEHIFTNPKYVDEAESFGRVSERFQIITIKREDIKKVIAKRVLNKTREQRLELEKLFSEYTQYYPTIQTNLNEYIDLFPLHPYVIQIFSELPYFEKRGVIQFTIQEVERVLDREFPHLITYDLIYDEIESKHTVKNLETVSPVVEAVQTLGSKIDLLDQRHQEAAFEIVKALGVLKLYGKSTNNGANAQELANTLLVLPSNKMLDAADEISLVINDLRKVTDGQFINCTKDGYYHLDLLQNIDYDQVIRRRADNLPENALDDEILSILKDQLMLGEEIGFGVFRNTSQWKSRKSFRDGQFVYETGKGEKAGVEGDFQIVFTSPFCASKRYRPEKNRLILSLSEKLPLNAFEQVKMLAAAKALINDNYQRSTIQNKHTARKKEVTRLLVETYLQKGIVEVGDTKKNVGSLIAREFKNFDELLSEIKPELFDPYFNEKYPKHPKFANSITRDNIKGEFSTAIKNLTSQNGTQTTLFSGSKSILSALELLDEKGNTSTSSSEVAREILDIAKENAGKNVPVNDFLSEYQKPPFGYDPVMTKFVMVTLTYTGEIALKAAGGRTIGSSEVAEVFKNGIEAFANVKYLTLESEFDRQPVIKLFMAIGLDQGTARKVLETNKRNSVIQDFRNRYIELKEMFDDSKLKLEKLSLQHSSIIDIEGMNARHETLKCIPFSDFEPVKTPNALKKIIYPESEIEEIAEAVELLEKLHLFYKKFFEEVEKELEYALEVQKILDEYSEVLRIEGIDDFMNESLSILGSAEKLLSPDDFNPLLGKLQSVRRKYKSAYYHAHEDNVGSKVDWSELAELKKSQTYSRLHKLRSVELINKRKFIEAENQIASLSGLQCPTFNVDLLDKNVTCKCGFPKGFKNENPNYQISRLNEKIRDIYEDWENTILTELHTYRDNLQYLSSEERIQIEEIIKSSQLPETISDSLVIALNNLFRELEIVKIDPDLFLEAVFKESQVMDYRTFDERIRALMQKLVAGKDLGKVRIKLAQKE